MTSSVAGYARRLAHVPGALLLLRLHPDGLPLARVAADLQVPESQLREELEVFFLTDVVDPGAVGLRSCALEFLAPGPDGALTDADLAGAEVIRLTDDSPLDELGVAFLSAVELGALYRAASELAALEPDNAVLSAAVATLGESVLAGVDGGGGVTDPVAADLSRAVTERRRVRIHYARTWRPGVVERTIEPWRVVRTRRGYEVDAGPLDEQGRLRTYLVSGVRSLDVLPETFERPGDVAELIAAARQPVPVRLVVPGDRAWVVERFAETVVVEQQDEDGVQLLAGVLPPVRQRVGLLLTVAGAGAFVVDPADLRDADQETARRLLEHHGLA